jgi:hypothetical protein
MVSKMCRIALLIVLASFTVSSAAWAKTCSNDSLRGTYAFLHGGTDSQGAPATGLTQVTFDPTTGKYTGVDTASLDGVISTTPLTATYAVASNCTATASVRIGSNPPVNVSFVVTSTGFWFLFQKTGANSDGFGVKQGYPNCTNAGVTGGFGFEATGVFLAGAPFTGSVDYIAELKFSVNPSGDGVISGRLAGSEDGTILTFADEPVTGTYSVSSDCTGTASITPKGQSALNFSFVVVDCGNELLAIETDADTVVSATLQRNFQQDMSH